jgi:hypothetical protein
MTETLEFTAVLNSVEGTAALSIDFPYDVFAVYGVKGQVKVKVTYDGIPYRGSLAKMGHHCHFLLVRKDIRAQLGKNPGDTVLVTVTRDLEARVVAIPPELETLLQENEAARATYNSLSYTHQKEYVQWINEAKKPETRANRVVKTVTMLLEKKSK